MDWDQAVETVFGDRAGLVRRIFATESRARLDVVVVFTGYGYKLADHAVSLVGANAGIPIYILGPDSNPWKDNPGANADNYREHIGATYDQESIPLDQVVAVPGPETRFTHGQARTLAKNIVEENRSERRPWHQLALVTAAYHQPRAYMTALKALLNYRLDAKVKFLAMPVALEGSDWAAPDPHLKHHASWLLSMTAEREKIGRYQKKGDVADWPGLERYLVWHF